MIYGEQWDCGCGWSNLFLRGRCRNCGLPASLAVGRKAAMEVVDERHRVSLACDAPPTDRTPLRGED